MQVKCQMKLQIKLKKKKRTPGGKNEEVLSENHLQSLGRIWILPILPLDQFANENEKRERANQDSFKEND